MKNLLAILVVLALATTLTFAQTPYNVPSNAPVQGQLVITGNVVAPAIVITPASASITLPDVAPGETVTIPSPDVKTFGVTCAKGYGITGSVAMNMTHNGASITGDYTIEPAAVLSATPTWAPLVEVNSPYNILGAQTVSGVATAAVRIKTFTALPGAAHGPRTFTFTLTASYKEQ